MKPPNHDHFNDFFENLKTRQWLPRYTHETVGEIITIVVMKVSKTIINDCLTIYGVEKNQLKALMNRVQN
ncbi:hypothetical protein CR513_38989, partial [Mucuna pruriens]